jgi:hypothetical protein
VDLPYCYVVFGCWDVVKGVVCTHGEKVDK